MSEQRRELLPQHAAQLRASGIADEVIAERGYFSATQKIDVGRLGFRARQVNVPALVIPVMGTDGAIGNYQSRPDTPRIGEGGKPVKYETPAKSRMCLDVPPRARRFIGDPETPLFVTEGVKKADSAVSHGIDCCLALLGVENWRGTNEDGGKTALPDWNDVALNGRTVYIVYDSDVMTKPAVYRALTQFKAWLERRDARVRLVYLPPGEGGAKVGLDDYLAAGHTVAELLALACDELRPPPEGEEEGASHYRETAGGIVWDKPTAHGAVETPLTNFLARIVGDIFEDDGAETRRVLEVRAGWPDRAKTFRLGAEQFAAMDWPIAQLGAGAVVYPGMGTRDQARAAIQQLSGAVPERAVYGHTGWRLHDGDWLYLHSGGAIGAGGAVAGVEVGLSPDLAGFALPPPPEGEELRAAVRSSLGMLEVAPAAITVPLFAGIWRAALGGSDFGLWLTGQTGIGKSELAALAQQHFGAGLDARHLPGAWSSTANALEGLAFLAQDALLVIDDFAPGSNQADAQRLHQAAERLLRGQGNHAGRQRMTADGRQRPTRPPRGMVLGTGEDVPRSQSARARALVLEVGPGDIGFAALTACQGAAREGRYAAALASFLRWLAGQYEARRDWLQEEALRLRGEASDSAAHRRTPAIVGGLGAALRCFLDFAVEVGALDAEQAYALWADWWAALGGAAWAQGRHQAASDPAARFLDLLGAVLMNGRGHVVNRDGGEPRERQRWGWRKAEVGPSVEWRPQGARLGWVDEDDLYLNREAAFAAVQTLARDTGEALPITGHTLAQRLHDRGLLASTEQGRETLAVRKMVEGRQRSVLHLRAASLFPVGEPD